MADLAATNAAFLTIGGKTRKSWQGFSTHRPYQDEAVAVNATLIEKRAIRDWPRRDLSWSQLECSGEHS
jgi:hypothetical protein